MKHLKMLGFAVIAALGLMAFVGAGTASATTLCTATDTPDCTGSHTYAAGTVIHVGLKTGTSMRITSGGSTIATCTDSTLKGTTSNTSATWVVINIAVLTWPEASCSQTTHTVKLGRLKIMWIEGTHNGTVELEETEVTTTLFGVSCTYGGGTGTDLGTLTGGSAPVLSIATTVTKTAGGFLCPGTSGWDLEYAFTEPHAIFVTT